MAILSVLGTTWVPTSFQVVFLHLVKLHCMDSYGPANAYNVSSETRPVNLLKLSKNYHIYLHIQCIELNRSRKFGGEDGNHRTAS